MMSMIIKFDINIKNVKYMLYIIGILNLVVYLNDFNCCFKN